MLLGTPVGADEAATGKWNATRRMFVPVFKAFWHKPDLPLIPGSLGLPFPGTAAGDNASYAEWTEGSGDKCYGMRNADGQNHGIVRTIVPGDGGWITEATYYEDEEHGLSCFWGANGFIARFYDHGEQKAYIGWNDGWSEIYSSGNKALILENDGLSLFKP